MLPKRLVLAVVFLPFAFSPAYLKAEIMGAYSVEWLTYSSEIVAVGKIVSIATTKGPYEVIYEDCTLEVSELIKSPGPKNIITFTYRRLGRSPAARFWLENGSELLVFLSRHNDWGNEERMKGALAPTSMSYPLSLISLDKPEKYVIDIRFRALKEKSEILNVTRNAIRTINDYLDSHEASSVKRYYLEVPLGTEAYENLWAGSSCFIFVPNFMSKESRESILQKRQAQHRN